MTDDHYPDMPSSEAEWRCHWAFYRLTVKQRDAAWREVERLRSLITKETTP
jgi:hypothetical protein